MEDKYYKYDQLTIHKEGLIMKIAKVIAISMFVGMLLLVFGCKKDSKEDDGTSPQYGAVDIQMSNAAQTEFLSANVEVKAVQLHYSGGDAGQAGWVELPTNVGVYDLLNLSENAYAIIARQTEIPKGTVTQMRVILGDQNFVAVVVPVPESLTYDTVTYALDLSSQEDTGLKFNLNTQVDPGKRLIISLDFDARESIIKQGEGQYQLKPVVKVKSIAYR